MAGPWEDYQTTTVAKPWEDYSVAPQEPKTDKIARSTGGFPNLGKSAMNLPGNFVSTVGGIGKNIIQHPVQSAENIVLGAGGLPVGAAEKVIDKYGGKIGSQFLDWFGRGALDKFYQPFEDQLKEKYGSYEKFKQTVEERPAEAMLDLSTALGIGSKAAAAGGMGRTAGALGAASEYTNPVTMAGKGVAAATAPLGRAMAPRVYESALKIPPSVPSDVRNKAVQTGLEGKYLPTDKGLERLQNDITATNKKIASEIDRAVKSGKTIDMAKVVNRVDQLKEFYGNLPEGRAKPFIDELEEVKSQYLTGKVTKPPVFVKGKQISPAVREEVGQITPQAAQKMKQTIYALQRKHYGEMKGATVEADKAVARGLKEELVAAHPELKALNAKDSALINLEEVLERAVNRTRNYDIVKFGDTISAVAGGALGGPGAAGAAGLSKMILGTPGVKARIAFALDKAAKKQGIMSKVGEAQGKANILYQGSQITEQGDHPSRGAQVGALSPLESTAEAAEGGIKGYSGYSGQDQDPEKQVTQTPIPQAQTASEKPQMSIEEARQRIDRLSQNKQPVSKVPKPPKSGATQYKNEWGQDRWIDSEGQIYTFDPAT